MIYNISYAALSSLLPLQERIGLGQLAGNHFKIVLRNVSSTAENLQKATDALSSDGFINYFGMQRFGTTNIPTYEVSTCCFLYLL